MELTLRGSQVKQLDTDCLHGEAIPAKVGQLMVRETKDSRLFLGDRGQILRRELRILYFEVIIVEENVFAIAISHNESVEIMLVEELEGASFSHI